MKIDKSNATQTCTFKLTAHQSRNEIKPFDKLELKV